MYIKRYQGVHREETYDHLGTGADRRRLCAVSVRHVSRLSGIDRVRASGTPENMVGWIDGRAKTFPYGNGGADVCRHLGVGDRVGAAGHGKASGG